MESDSCSLYANGRAIHVLAFSNSHGLPKNSEIAKCDSAQGWNLTSFFLKTVEPVAISSRLGGVSEDMTADTTLQSGKKRKKQKATVIAASSAFQPLGGPQGTYEYNNIYVYTYMVPPP